jgi:peroxiredoxin Q/BCP
MVNVKAGDPLPDAELTGYPTRARTKLSDFRGKWVVLYFYPRDDTSGCTKEACGFRDSIGQFRELGAEVVGVSTDGVDSHEKFTGKYRLNFPLLSDTRGELGAKLGVLKEGRNSMKRVTFLVNPQGQIAKVYLNVDPTIHATEVIEDLKSLRGS